MTGRRAAIDVGSNSLLLTVVDEGGRTLHDEARVVGLGKGLGDGGTLRPDRLAAAAEVLADYVRIAASFGVPAPAIRAVATSAARRATNAAAAFAEIERAHGLHVRIVSGEEEARLTWLGAGFDLALPPGDRLVVDLGGGSTELAVGDADGARARVSLEIGTVRLTEAHLAGADGEVPDRVDPAAVDAVRAAVDRAFGAAAPVYAACPAGAPVIGVAGTVTTLLAMREGLQRYDAARVHGARLSREDLADTIATLGVADRAERRRLAAVSPERADYLLAGAIVLDRALAGAGEPAMIVSDRGLRFGLLAEG